MAISKVNPVISSSVNASAITCASPLTMYSSVISLTPGIYTVTCVNTTVAKVHFMSNATTILASATTVSGTVTLNIASDVSSVRIWTDTGSNVVVTITKTAAALTNNWSGTLDTITSSGTYTGTSASGYGYAVVVGGGGGGGGGQDSSPDNGGGGGGSGDAIGALVQLTGSIPVTIGAPGAAGLGNRYVTTGTTGGTGGTTTFGSITAVGGNGGDTYGNPGSGGGTNGVAGTYNGANGNVISGGNGGVAINPYSFMGFATIGTPGIGALSTSYGNSAQSAGTNGAGGGGGAAGNGGNGGNGSAGGAGVVYVLRF